MSILDYFRRTSRKDSASVAKERLQIIVAHERGRGKDDYLPMLQKELLRVISKYVKVQENQVKVELEQNGDVSVLGLNITLPESASSKSTETVD